MDVLVSCDSLYRVGVWGRDGTAVDGKRLPSDGRFGFRAIAFLYRVGVWGRDGTRMTGSAYTAMDVMFGCDSLC